MIGQKKRWRGYRQSSLRKAAVTRTSQKWSQADRNPAWVYRAVTKVLGTSASSSALNSKGVAVLDYDCSVLFGRLFFVCLFLVRIIKVPVESQNTGGML